MEITWREVPQEEIVERRIAELLADIKRLCEEARKAVER